MSHVRKEDGGENNCSNMTSNDWAPGSVFLILVFNFSTV